LLLWITMIVALLVATGCGARVPAGQSPPAGSGTAPAADTGHPAVPPDTIPTSPTTLVGPRQLTVADNGATVRLARGQSVTTNLVAQGMFSWHVPAATGSAVRQMNNSGGYPTSQPAQATFLAVNPGTATLTAMNDTACLHAHPPCLPPQQQWQVTVLVG
jgi:hypothetical protein